MTGWLTEDVSDVPDGTFRRFVARQPILNRAQETFGYELLFRTGWENSFHADGEVASRHVIDNSLAFGLESIVADKVAFVNCTRDLIVQELPVLLPPTTVLELLEDIEIDPDFLASCDKLRNMGYRLALDDFDFSRRWEPLLPLADFIKIDFRASSAADRKVLLQSFDRSNVRFIAEKVEDAIEFRTALQEGFHLFQGYFFTRPIVLARPALGGILHRFELLAELQQPRLRFARILDLLKQETAVSYRLLRLANSAAVGSRETVASLQRALVIVGEDRFRKLAITALTVDMCGGQPSETHRALLQTCRFCESLSIYLGLSADSMYLFGMISVILPLLQLRPESFASILNHHPGMLQALSGADNLYAEVLRAAHALDRGAWEQLSLSAGHLGIPAEIVARQHGSARAWADEVLVSMN